MQWYIELQSSEGEQGEEVLGEADPDEDYGDFTTRSDHDSESEQEAEEPEDGDNSEWLSDSGIPCYLGKDDSTKKKFPPVTRTKIYNIFSKKPGPINNATQSKTILDCFQIYMSNNVIEITTNSTNIYIALDLLRPQILKRMHLQNIPRLLKEKCRMILNIEEPSTSAEVQEAKRLKTGKGRCYLCPRKKIRGPETIALHALSGFALSIKKSYR
ncbi:unnamed protein product [Callosobruchus maculatus]|uniref:PiggyBac transposable element-derived protein domain-containing protein n=1 Tax=Callosobruchus maculatus TaxID=64391 RepID=A0A653DN99_CALMS|nr:unnamed protein product [Callosobruchus maculatus]VEN61720.1 unnamed protein product [Callosobruchus maculatus]